MYDLSRVAVALFLALAPVRCAAAQPADTTAREPQRSAVPDEQPSPLRAGLYSLGGTVFPVAAGLALMRGPSRSLERGRLEASVDPDRAGAVLLLGGLVVGPALGHLYADAPRRGLIGVGLRGGASLVGVAGATIILVDAVGDPLLFRGPTLSLTGRIAEGVLVGAGIVVVGSALVDIATAPLSVRLADEAHGARLSVRPRVSPMADRVGLSARLRF